MSASKTETKPRSKRTKAQEASEIQAQVGTVQHYPTKVTKERRDLAFRASKKGITPLEMLLTTAQDLWAEAHTESPDGTIIVNLGKRLQACAIAEKAMPYVHPRLGNVSIDTNKKQSIDDYSDEELLLIAAQSAEVIDDAG